MNEFMTHITLNTGHIATQQRPPKWFFNRLFPFVRSGGGDLGTVAPDLSGYRVEIVREKHAASMAFYQGPQPLVLGVVCWDAAEAPQAWQSINGQYLSLSDTLAAFMDATEAPSMPEQTPWLAVVQLPGFYLAADAMKWIGDAENCFAWAIMDAQ